MPPKLFTRATKALILRETLSVRSLPGNFSEDSQILYRSNTPSKRIDKCERRLLVAQSILSPADLGTAGEDYARAILFRSGEFAGIPRRRSRVASDPFDLLAHLKADQTVRYLIEVKNRREIFYPSSRGATFFGKLIQAAIEADRFPLLIVSHLSMEAVTVCRRLGIFIIMMRRQIIPNSVSSKKLRILDNAFGPDPYEQIEPNRALHHKITEATAADIANLQNTKYLEFCRRRWDQTKIVLPLLLRRSPKTELTALTLAAIERLLRQ